ncbi:MAG TPA: preprotein translocase subunit SecG [Gammaproteobacteria bacterium]|nr:preprotein translocase subunit SecG [Gammaproteobacteria bacterium]
MLTALLVIDVLACAGLIGLILLQHGKGADVGAAFGSGASQTVFGSQGSASFLTRTTAVLAVVFFAASLGLAYLSGQQTKGKDVVQRLAPVTAPAPTPQSDLPPQSAAPEGKVAIDPITGLPARPKTPSGETKEQPAPAPVAPTPPN